MMAGPPTTAQSEAVFDPGELAALLARGGAVDRILDDFEERDEQRAMVEKVGRAFDRQQVLLVEAGTGTGKSLAYALPAALWARRTGQRVVISTGTINLQQQLINKDLPLVLRALGGELDFVLIKGRANYLCRRRLAERLRQQTLLQTDGVDEVHRWLSDWAERSRDGSRSDLERPVPAEAWEQVCADADACLGRRCPLREDCFFVRARRAAEDAALLVVNHHLLFADLALRLELDDWSNRAVLPPFERVVLDEGHALEDVASGFFGLQLTRSGALRTVGRVLPAARKGGLLAELEAELGALGAGPTGGGTGATAALAGELRRALADAFDALVDFGEQRILRSGGGERKLRLDGAALGSGGWVPVREAFGQAAWQADKLAVELERLSEQLDNLREGDGGSAEGRAGARRLGAMADACRQLTEPDLDGWVRWVELPARPGGRFAKLALAPLVVADKLDESLFGPQRTVVITSATLAEGGSFDYLAGRLGLDGLESGRLQRLQVDSPFDFARQARLAVPDDMPPPGTPEFERRLPDAVMRLATASRGSALVLFTARGLMERTFELTRDALVQAGLQPLCQGHQPRDRLLERLRDEPGGVLFGTDSFWQGVDVVGDALRLVIITRLPFDVPSEPLVQARAEQVAAGGRSAFAHYSLPRAVLKLKQGFGRLIRSRADRGAVVVLDPRLVQRRYGRRFLGSLPAATRVTGGLAAVESVLRDLFARRS
jgi:ATP-dependent DNA helicase DinG